MPTTPLPEDATFELLRKQAKTLQRSVRVPTSRALDQVRELHPRADELLADPAALAAFKLSDAQLMIARRYGFASWRELRDHVEPPVDP